MRAVLVGHFFKGLKLMRIRLIIFSLMLAASLASCGILKPHKVEIRQGNIISPEMRARLKIGMTPMQVKAALGTPLINDPFHANRWDYIYRFEQQGQLLDDQRLTLYFENDTLQRIEDAAPVK